MNHNGAAALAGALERSIPDPGRPMLTSIAVALAQGQDAAQTVVTATRSTSSATSPSISRRVITAEELAATGERSLPRAIARASGVFVQETNLGGGAPILRGLIGNQILIVVDGVRLNDATTRGGPNQSLNGIDPANVESVEVFRGPTSVLYGSDALGGAIVIHTKSRKPGRRDPEFDAAHALRGEFAADYDSATHGSRESLLGSAACSATGVLLGGSLQEWKDLEAADERVDNTGYHGNSWFGSLEQMLGSDHWMRFSAMRTRDFDVPRTDRMNTGFNQVQPSDAEHLFTLQDRQRYLWSFNAGGNVQVRASFRKYTEERQIRGFTSSARRLEQDVTETAGLGADGRVALGSHLVSFGLDADFDDVDSTRRDVNINTGVVTPNNGIFQPGSEYLSSGVFVQDEFELGATCALTAGARYSYFEFEFKDAADDTVDGDFDALSGALGFAWQPAQAVRVTTNVAQGFLAPNLSELARNATFAGGTELASADLDPEESFYQELALELVQPIWSCALALYHNEISDVVGRRLQSDPTPGIPGDEIYVRANTGDLEFYGVELSGRVKLGGAQSPYSLGTYVEFTHGKQYDDFVDPNLGGQPFDDQPASKVPPLHGRLSFVWAPAQACCGIEWADLSLWVADEQDELSPADLSDPRIDPDGTDGWTRLDADVGGSLGDGGLRARWNVGLHNILDEEYRVHGSGFDAPGFGVVAGLSVSM